MIKQAIERAKAEIRAHVQVGVIPSTVSSFSELHDYVDANEYGGVCDLVFDGSMSVDEANEVQDTVSKWLQDGGHR